MIQREENAWLSTGKFLLILCLFGLTMGCVQEEKVPENIISKDEFVDLLFDVQLLEAGFKQKLVQDSAKKQIMAENYAFFFKKHQTKPEQFKNSYKWWASRTNDMIEILNAVAEKTNQMESQLREQKPNP